MELLTGYAKVLFSIGYGVMALFAWPAPWTHKIIYVKNIEMSPLKLFFHLAPLWKIALRKFCFPSILLIIAI